MDFDELTIAAVLERFQVLGGYCDCEILFNVDRVLTGEDGSAEVSYARWLEVEREAGFS